MKSKTLAINKSLQIGVAPMEGVTGYAARIFFWLCSGITAQTSSFVRISHGFKANKKFFAQIPEISLKHSPPYLFTPQLMASDPRLFSSAANALKDYFPVIELNCGCPAPRVFSHAAGSALVGNQQRFEQFIEDISSDIDLSKVALKIRTGVDTHDSHALLQALKKFNIARLTVHGRTRRQHYTGYARWDLIDTFARSLKVDVIGSGDINSFSSLLERRNYIEKLKGIIIGRGILRNPWCPLEIHQGAPVSMSIKCLVNAIKIWFKIHWLEKNNLAQLLKAHDQGLFQVPLGTNTDKWRAVDQYLDRLGHNYNENSLGAFNRTKMLWNYMRSNLNLVNDLPSVFRIKDPQLFIDKIAETMGNQSTPPQFAHNVVNDPIFAGSCLK